jgi:hypothetical protein
MRLNRRAALTLGAVTGLAGCGSLGASESTADGSNDTDDAQTTPQTTATEPAATAEPAAQQAAQYFNDDGELTAPVDNDHVQTRKVSPNVAAGHELVAYRDGETATVADGRTREVLYSDEDIGVIVNRIQEDFPEGVHLHLTDLFEYSESIVISTPMRLTGERAVSNFSKRGANAAPVDPVGLRFTGSGIAVQLYKGGGGVRGVHVEDLFVHAESGTVAFQIYGPNNESENTYSPWADGVFRNVVVEGGSEAGFEIRGATFLSTFDSVRSYGSGGHGIWIHRPEENDELGYSGNNTYSFLRSKFAGGDGIRIDAHGGGVFGQLYANFCKGRGVALGTEGAGNHYHRIYGEVNEGVDVDVPELLNGRVDYLIGKGGEPSPPSIDYEGPAVRLGETGLYTAHLGKVQALDGDLVVKTMREGSTVEEVVTRNGATLDTTDALLIDSVIERVVSDEDDSGFNEATLRDGDEAGTVRFNFDTRFNRPPTLMFGRRGGGIEDVSFVKTSANGQFFAADIQLAESGGVVDVQAHMSNQV